MKKTYKKLYLHDVSTDIIIPISMVCFKEEGDSLYIKVLRKLKCIEIK